MSSSVHLAPGVKLISENHDLNQKHKHVPAEPIIIEKNVWLGANCIVLPGVRIGKNSVIGAGSVVTKAVPADHIAVGVPARMRALH